MVAKSEPLLLPFFFTFCVHLSFFVLLSYWDNWELPSQPSSLGPSIGVSLRSLPTPPARPISPARPTPRPTPSPPKAEKELKQAEPSQPKPAAESTPREDELETLIEDLKKTEQPQQEQQQAEPRTDDTTTKEEAAEEDGTDDQQQAAQRQSMRNQALAYYERNKALVEQNFNPGTSAQRNQFQGLVTRIKIYLDAEGNLINVDVVASSGNGVFDIEAERAVKRVKQFIIPDDKRLQDAYFREIIMEFSLSQ